MGSSFPLFYSPSEFYRARLESPLQGAEYPSLSEIDEEIQEIAGLFLPFPSSSPSPSLAEKEIVEQLPESEEMEEFFKEFTKGILAEGFEDPEETLSLLEKEKAVLSTWKLSLDKHQSNLTTLEDKQIAKASSEKIAALQKTIEGFLATIPVHQKLLDFRTQYKALRKAYYDKDGQGLVPLNAQTENLGNLLPDFSSDNLYVLSKYLQELVELAQRLSKEEKNEQLIHHGFSLYLIDPTFPTSNWLPGFETTNFLTTKFCIPQIFS